MGTITVYELTTPLTTGNAAPYIMARNAPGYVVPTAGATTHQLEINDTDGTGLAAPVYDDWFADKAWDMNQTLAQDMTFNSGTILKAGTVLSYGPFAHISAGPGLDYMVAFLTKYTDSTNLLNTIVSTRVMMAFPIGDAPVFDPTLRYTLVKSQISVGPTSTAYTCFCPGTLIDTAEGPRAVETLCAGMQVVTRDHGLQTVRWAGGRHLTAAQVDAAPNLRPVHIAPGALGAGLPQRALSVSPQHRVLVRSRIALRMFGAAEVLVAAKHLVGLPGITFGPAEQGVGYLHILLDRHELVRSEGAWSESLYTGAEAMKALSPAERREIFAVFPHLRTARPAPAPAPARPLTCGRSARKLAERHARNCKALVQ